MPKIASLFIFPRISHSHGGKKFTIHSFGGCNGKMGTEKSALFAIFIRKIYGPCFCPDRSLSSGFLLPVQEKLWTHVCRSINWSSMAHTRCRFRNFSISEHKWHTNIDKQFGADALCVNPIVVDWPALGLECIGMKLYWIAIISDLNKQPIAVLNEFL